MKQYNEDLKKVMIIYSDLMVQSSDEYRTLINIHNIAESAYGERFNPNIVKLAFENKDSVSKLDSANDYYYLLFSTAIKNNNMKKTAYPFMFGETSSEEPFDLQKWAGLVYKIYDAVGSGDMDMRSAIDYYADTLNSSSGEDLKFKKWVEYYQKGEHLKYSSDDDSSINKMAYDFSLSPPAKPDAANAYTNPTGIKERINNMQTLFESASNEAKDNSESKKEYKSWKSKLHTAIRRIDKLLRQSDEFIDNSSQQDLADLLHKFDQEVRGLSNIATASDITHKYANQFKKLGFNQVYNEFSKYAQEAEQAAQNQEVEQAPQAPAATGEATPAGEPAAPVQDNPEKKDKGSTPLERALTPTSELKEQEYESLAGDVGLSDAIQKLEDIAGRLSDRRTIRLLAEFDIILDKIGIAPMFPELAEAQSKLIDSYSYALTRVTKMLGMLSSGKSLFEISDVKKKELIGKTMKELNRAAEIGEQLGGDTGPTKTPEATQEGLEGAGLAEPAAPAPAPAPAAEAAPASPPAATTPTTPETPAT